MRKSIATLALFSVLIVACQPQPKPIGWALLHPTNHPPAVSHSGFAYDTNLNQGIVFGGLTNGAWSDETWVWDGGNWLMANSPTSPAGRDKTAMAYDAARHRIVLFGGAADKTVFDDTWEWNGSYWQMMSPPHKPPARCCHAMAYDSVQKKVLVYGGWNNITKKFFNDTWEWDGQDWTDVSCCNSPLASGHTLVDFSDEGKVVAVPSSDGANTWYWDGDKWGEIAVHPDPSRADARSAYDSVNQRVVFYGGIRNGTILNETWIFNGKTWIQLNLPVQPPERYGHIMFYDTKRKSIILFGGAANAGGAKKLDQSLTDTWELNLPEDLSSLPPAASTPAAGKSAP